MRGIPDDLRQQLQTHGQNHVLAHWDGLDDVQRAELLTQLKGLNLAELRQLYDHRDRSFPVPPAERIGPVPVRGPDPDRHRRLGEELLRAGQVAALVVAGGQGSRLGFEQPKGLFPIGPVSNKSLFQIHAEKIRALGRRYGRPVPLLVMTSPATHAETLAFFEQQRNFGLSADELHFFQQGTMPALDKNTGKLLLEAPGRLFLSPNGHGGTLTALADSGLLAELHRRGIRQVFYFQVDNPLIKVADPVFLGLHCDADAEMSLKIVAKESPQDKLGNVVQVDGRCTIIEYSDLPEELGKQTDAGGKLRIWAGSTAIHIFSVAFLERMTSEPDRIPFHVAVKKVPCLGPDGQPFTPTAENALKFERFIFDVLPLADRFAVVETTRPEEFVPLKNADGADSPAAVRQALSDVAGRWLEQAGVTVPWRDGHVAVPLEISPLVALDADELAGKIDRRLRVSGPTYLE